MLHPELMNKSPKILTLPFWFIHSVLGEREQGNVSWGKLKTIKITIIIRFNQVISNYFL